MPRRPAFQFKITLEHITPLIWRRFQVSDLYSFWDLHVAIQDVMGWQDYHLHEFEATNPVTGKRENIAIPDDEYDNFEGAPPTFASWDRQIRDYFTEPGSSMMYNYDFGDGWRHKVEFEKSCPKMPGLKYPICLAGERACPPEDVGGTGGYADFLDAIIDPHHEEHHNLKMWAGDFWPERFNPKKVKFDSPSRRWRKAFTDD